MQKINTILKIFIILFLSIYGLSAADAKDNNSIDKIENNILMAENYLWLSMDEGAFTKVDKKTLKYIDISNNLLKSLSIPNKELYSHKIESIKDQFYSLRAVKGKSLHGYFPLLKYTVSDFFFMPSDPKIHTLVKNPKYLAVDNAIQASVKIIRQLHQRHIFINSIPHDSEAEEIAFNIFNGTDKLYSHFNEEAVIALKDIKDFKSNNITQKVSNKLCDYVGDDSIYIVTIARNLTEDKEYYYTIATSNYGYKGKNDLMSTDAFGYAIDESSNWPVIIFVHLILLLFVIAFTLYESKKYTWKEIISPFIFFILGRVAPWIIIPALLALKPGGEAHALYSFWWVLLLGIAIFIVPIIVVKLFYKKALEYISLPDISGKGDIVGLSVAAGSVAFLVIPYLYAFGEIFTIGEIAGFMLFSIAVLVSGYVMGKILDDNDKMDEKNLIYFAITSSLLIVSFMHGKSIYLIATSLFTIIVGWIILKIYMKKVEKESLEENKLILDNHIASDGECENIDNIDLKDRVQNPPYQQFDYFKNILDTTKEILDEKATYVVLKGNAGSGKTVTAKALINTIGTEITNQNKTVLLLSSVCEKHDGDEIAYGMFYSLLDSTIGVDLFGQRKKDDKFDKAISIASSFLMGPVASFLSPESGSSATPFSKTDIYILVKQKFIELSKNNTLIIMIDDLQWIDEASKDLFNYLMEEFRQGSEHKIMFIFTVRATEEGKQAVNNMNLESYTHSIGFIEKNEQKILLEKSFCLFPSSARWIVDWTSEQNSDGIYPYILVDAVGNLSRADVLEIKENRFSINEDFDFENPPIPEGPKKEVKEFMANHPEYVEILSLASLFGKEFNVSYLADALDITYLECLRNLDAISVESGLVFDVLDKDDIYQFRSQIIIDAVREYINYSNEGIKSTHVPQAIRHFHALAASALEHRLEENNSSKLIMEIGNHYYAAGKLYANNAVEYLVKASDGCRKMFQYDDALHYLDKADEVLELVNKHSSDSEELRLIVECDKANVQGVGADNIAEKTLIYIGNNLECRDELKFVATRACYDAALQNNYDQSWFAKSSQVAKEYLLPSDSELMQAEGHHFVAVCMKPRTDKEKKEQLNHYNSAIELTKVNYPASYAKVANSLAESLSYGDIDSKKRAKELFLDSLEIKENAEIKDLPGIARTYGGLGRLTFFSTSTNIAEAKEYFQKDLDISKDINDQQGISKMNSFLGGCAMKEELYDEAIAYYNKSIQMKNNSFDVHASYVGKFAALDKLNRKNELESALNKYIYVLDNLGIPHKDYLVTIIKILEKHFDLKNSIATLERLKDDKKTS